MKSYNVTLGTLSAFKFIDWGSNLTTLIVLVRTALPNLMTWPQPSCPYMIRDGRMYVYRGHTRIYFSSNQEACLSIVSSE